MTPEEGNFLRETRKKVIEKMVKRMENPVFQGRQDWLLRWDKKACRFKTVDIEPIMLMMAMRRSLVKNDFSAATRAHVLWHRKERQ